MKMIPELEELRKFFKNEAGKLPPVPSTDKACMIAMYMVASSRFSEAICNHESPDPDWVRIMVCLEKINPDFVSLYNEVCAIKESVE